MTATATLYTTLVDMLDTIHACRLNDEPAGSIINALVDDAVAALATASNCRGVVPWRRGVCAACWHTWKQRPWGSYIARPYESPPCCPHCGSDRIGEVE